MRRGRAIAPPRIPRGRRIAEGSPPSSENRPATPSEWKIGGRSVHTRQILGFGGDCGTAKGRPGPWPFLSTEHATEHEVDSRVESDGETEKRRPGPFSLSRLRVEAPSLCQRPRFSGD